MSILWLVLPGLLIWFSILVLPWRSWSTRESLDAEAGLSADLSGISVLIPARNEEDVIERTLQGLMQQGKLAKLILVDDQSSDNTAACAQRIAGDALTLVKGRALEAGWSGKLWALEQGREQVSSEYILLLDADIELQAGTLASLLDKLQREQLDMISLMAFLRMQSAWERLLMPAFIYFFKLLYPFALSNSRSRVIAAAAGGCILIKADKLSEIGGFAALKDALIDDCTLARLVKNSGGRIWTGLTHSAISHRQYNNLQSIWDMVARTAYTQLRYSVSLLLLCTVLLLLAFVIPVISLIVTDLPIVVLPFLSCLMMMASYVPVLKYYGQHPLWACSLPFTATLYLCMTWSSAMRHWKGTGAVWKNRAYAGPTG